MTGEEQGLGESSMPPVTGDRSVTPVTGDRGVDRVLTDLESQLRDDQADAVAALTEAHRRLQVRLSDPGPTPPTPG